MEISKVDYWKDDGTQNLVELNNRVEDFKSKNMLYPKPELISGNELLDIFNKPVGKWMQDAKHKIEEMQIENPNITKEAIIEALKNNI